LWCARDIEANLFWLSLGFTALAYRAGGVARDRVHILWARPMPDTPVDRPLWRPDHTSSGLIRRTRIVMPFEPGQKWNDPASAR
jgi:hypothetical protein